MSAARTCKFHVVASPGNVETKVLFCKTRRVREVCFKQAWTCSKLMLGNWDFSLLFSCTRPTFVSTTVDFFLLSLNTEFDPETSSAVQQTLSAKQQSSPISTKALLLQYQLWRKHTVQESQTICAKQQSNPISTTAAKQQTIRVEDLCRDSRVTQRPDYNQSTV